MADGSMETEDTESGGTATWTQITPEPEKKAQATENPETGVRWENVRRPAE